MHQTSEICIVKDTFIHIYDVVHVLFSMYLWMWSNKGNFNYESSFAASLLHLRVHHTCTLF